MIISIRNVTKMYRVYADLRDRLKEYLCHVFRGFMKVKDHEFARAFWALRGISFEVKKGESIGIILGSTQKEIDAKFDEVEAFAEIGSFIDRPIKTYSRGMMVGLDFAVQTVIEPDILIVDEALSAGDFFFAQKCATRMRELRERGTTLLYVPHDMSLVRDLCERAVYLRQG